MSGRRRSGRNRVKEPTPTPVEEADEMEMDMSGLSGQSGGSDLSLQTNEYIPATGEIMDEDTFKILVATDIHLGFNDNDRGRVNDSFITFEEILQIARENNVDFLLLGGDLFHENRPKPDVLLRATELCRKYCLGDRPVAFEYVGDPAHDFPTQTEPEVNYYNPNINIALPIFTIHGNHDDPVGIAKTSAVDHLAEAKLLNHFGAWNNLNRVTVSPVLFTKGETKLAMYGLGHMKDERLNRLMRDKKVLFVAPEEDNKDWFNILVLHQNRVKHGPKNYIPESYIPGYMDLVIWGHEHECRKDLDIAEGLEKTNILQPGSSVATSLCPGEALDKHVFLVQINQRRFKKEAIKLKTVRPFVMKDVVTKEIFEKLPKNAAPKDRTKHLEKYLENVVNHLMVEAEDKRTMHEKQPSKPLIRVRVFYDDADDTFHPSRFSQKFIDKVANDDIIMFKKMVLKRDPETGEINADELGDMMQEEDDDLDSHVEAIVENYFAKAHQEGKKDAMLEVLSAKGLSDAVKCAVDKGDADAISIVIENQVSKAIAYMIEKKVAEETYEDHLEEFRKKRAECAEQEKKDVDKLLEAIKPNLKSNGSAGDLDEDMEEANGGEESPIEIDDDDDDAPPRKGRGRGQQSSRAKGRGSRGGAASKGRGRSKKSSDEDRSVSPSPTRGRGGGSKGRGRGKAAPAPAPSQSQANAKQMKQTTLNVRKSPRKPTKGGGRMVFDSDSD